MSVVGRIAVLALSALVVTGLAPAAGATAAEGTHGVTASTVASDDPGSLIWD